MGSVCAHTLHYLPAASRSHRSGQSTGTARTPATSSADAARDAAILARDALGAALALAALTATAAAALAAARPLALFRRPRLQFKQPTTWSQHILLGGTSRGQRPAALASSRRPRWKRHGTAATHMACTMAIRLCPRGGDKRGGCGRRLGFWRAPPGIMGGCSLARGCSGQ